MFEEWAEGRKKQLTRDLDQGIKLVNAISGTTDIRNIMEKRGYSAKEHALGLEMLTGLLCYKRPWPEKIKSELAIFNELMSELNAWARKNLPIGATALKRFYPEQGEHIFAHLLNKTRKFKRNLDKIMMGKVKNYVDTVQALREGSDPKRTESREADLAAVKILEERNMAGPELEAHLLKRIDQAFHLTSSSEFRYNREESEAYLALAQEFHLWLMDWRQTARSAITNRRHLISLGLAKPRK